MENLNTFTPLPPGYRFHPTDEELVDYYLRRKVNSRRIETDAIKEVDLYKIEPWDLQEICRIRNNHEQNEWYFFSHKDKKYPTGTRTNRATAAGFWKATGRDKAIYLKHELIGMRKTLVFYKGRAPNGQKSDWIMHEYRLESDENGAPQEEGWAVCRVFKKRAPSMRNTMEHEIPCWYDEQVSFMPDLDSPRPPSQSNNLIIGYNSAYSCRRELDNLRRFPLQIPHDHLMNMPVTENSKVLLANSSQGTSNSNNALIPYGFDMMNNQENATMEQFHGNYNGPMVLIGNNGDDQGGAPDQVTDWRVLDKFVASQLSHDQDVRPKGNNDNYSSSTVEPEILATPMSEHSNKEEKLPDNASTSTSSSQIDVWK